MMPIVKRYLPDTSIFGRYHSSIQFRLISGYHRNLSEKYRYFIRHMFDTSVKPFYTNADIEEITPTLDAHEIINCGWESANWRTVPWQYNVSGGNVTEVFRGPDADKFSRGYNGKEIAYKRGGLWVAKFFFGRDCSYWRTTSDDYWHMRLGPVWVSRHRGEYQVGPFMNMKPMTKAPDEVIYPILRQMKAQKWGGFYNDEIEHILETSGLLKTRI